MKRLYIAVLFLFISVSLCVFEQYTVKSTYDQMTGYIETAIEYKNKNDNENAEKTCKAMSEYWENRQPFLTAMIEHSSLNETSVAINSLNGLAQENSDDLVENLITAKNQIKSIYDNQRISFGNIF